MQRAILPAACAVLLLSGAAAASEATGDYAADLGRVYGGYQRILALKEACDTAVPATRPVNDKAFAGWQARNQALLRELEDRVTAMIRLASANEKEYSRNVGKYQGAILQERREYRDMLLALDAQDLRAQCEGLPEALKRPDSDLARSYPGELETIRKRK